MLQNRPWGLHPQTPVKSTDAANQNLHLPHPLILQLPTKGGCNFLYFTFAINRAGLTPANNESANKKKSTRCSKAGQYLKPLLIQCALAAVKSKKNPYYAIKYKRLAKRRGRKKAVIAIARMMLTSIYHMILNNEEWKPDDYEAIIHPSKPAKVALTLDNVIQFLGEQGADPETLKLLQQQCAVTPG